jgi:DNA-binding IclR family transcriptional regulator
LVQPVQRGAQILAVLGSGTPRLGVFTGQARTTRAALARVPAQVRRRGWAVPDREAAAGGAGIAAPIVSRDGVVAGAIGVGGAAGRRLNPGARGDLVREVVTAAWAVFRDLAAGRGGVALSALS